MTSYSSKPVKKSTELDETGVLALKAFSANYMLKNPKAKSREVKRAAEKHFNIKIVDE